MIFVVPGRRLAAFLIGAALVVSVGCDKSSSKPNPEDKRVLLKALRAAAAAQELYARDHRGNYTRRIKALRRYGARADPDVEIRVVSVNNSRFIFLRFCIEARLPRAGMTMHFVQPIGLRAGPCRYWWITPPPPPPS